MLTTRKRAGKRVPVQRDGIARFWLLLARLRRTP